MYVAELLYYWCKTQDLQDTEFSDKLLDLQKINTDQIDDCDIHHKRNKPSSTSNPHHLQIIGCLNILLSHGMLLEPQDLIKQPDGDVSQNWVQE